jgi:predicted nucleic acid-binding protein
VPLYLLDTNVLIDVTGKKKSAAFINKLLDDGPIQLATSVLCLAEFAVGAGRVEEKFIRDWLQSGDLEVLFLDSSELVFAAGNLRKRNGFTMPDALILATALKAKAHLLTQDREFLKRAKIFIAATDPTAPQGMEKLIASEGKISLKWNDPP